MMKIYMMKVSRKILFAILAIVFIAPSFASVGGFIEDIEPTPSSPSSSKNKNTVTTEKNTKKKNSSSNSYCADFITQCCSSDAFINLIITATVLPHINFGNYPYCDGDYIERNKEKDFILSNKFIRGYVEGAFLGIKLNNTRTNSLGYNAAANINLYKSFGVTLENFLIADQTGKLATFRVGGFYELFQSRIFSTDFYIQWAHTYHDLISDGATFGIRFELYPIKPLIIRARLGIWIITENSNIIEMDVSTGVAFNRLELFAAYRFWFFYEKKSTSHGLNFGARIYF